MERFLDRELGPRVVRALESMPVVVVTGMRQVGKTTLLRNEPALAGRRYLSLDDFATQVAVSGAPETLLEGEEPTTIDEVQKEAKLVESIKVAVDRARRPGRFLLSGSANLLLMEQVTESLAGRAVYLTLSPFSHRELHGVTGRPFVVNLLETGRVEGQAFTRVESAAVLKGGMPPVAVTGAKPEFWFQGFEQTYLERDIRTLSQVADLAAFRRLLRLAALRTGKLLSFSQLARDAALAPSTASRYVGLLQTSFAIFLVPPYLKNPTARLVKSSKLYVADSGLASFLIGNRGGIGTAADPEHGALVETWVAANLKALLDTWRPRAELCFWNVQGRHEVDFVIDDGTRTLAIEVKAGSRWSGKDLRGLRRFLELHPDCMAGLLACDIASPVTLGDRLHAVPLGMLVG